MKIALVHEILTMKGGAEKVLKIFSEMYPEAPIYTLLYDEKKMGDWFPKHRVRTSIINPHGDFNHHHYLRKFATATETWDFSEYDVVLSSSSAFVHGIITNGHPKHISYIHSPARYLWDRTHDVINDAAHGPLGWLKRIYLERTFHTLRLWDAEVAPRPDVLLAASKTVQRRIQLYWDRDSTVVYPPIDDMWFEKTYTPIREQMEHPDYFLSVGTLARYKRLDLAIQACNATGSTLKIVGEGPDMDRLKKLAGPTIEFYGYRGGDELGHLYASAKALIIPGEEDFGLAPVESLACCTPVIAFEEGGPKETIREGETGTFFGPKTGKNLEQVLRSFDQQKYSREKCIHGAKEFTRKDFEHKIRTYVNACAQSLS